MALQCNVQVGKMTTVRDLLVMARHGLIPQQLAHINEKTGTPVRMILLYGTVCGEFALQLICLTYQSMIMDLADIRCTVAEV